MAYIKAISYYLPENKLTNEILQEEFPNLEVVKLTKSIGVEQRSIANKNTTAADLAYEAANSLFDSYPNEKKESIDFVIFCTQSPDYFLPSTACILQDRLKLSKQCGAFSYDLGCSGYVYGLAIANSFVDSGMAKNVLLLTGDTITHYMHPEDKNRLLFGDAGTATLISSTGLARIGKTVYGTDGSGYKSLILHNRGNRCQEITGHTKFDEHGNIQRDDYFYMDGEAIFNFTVDTIPSLINQTLKSNNLKDKDISLYLFHQANKFMLNTLRKVCKIEKDKFYINLEQSGNTTSSTIPIGLKDYIGNNIVKKTDKIMVAGFGVGLSWAATVLEF